MAFQVNYGRRFFSNNKVALYGEINFLASSLRDVSSSVPTATRDFSSRYLTPGIRVGYEDQVGGLYTGMNLRKNF